MFGLSIKSLLDTKCPFIKDTKCPNVTHVCQMILYATIVVRVLYDINLIESIIKKQIEVVLRISLI